MVKTLDPDEIQRLEDAVQTERDALIVRVLADTDGEWASSFASG